MSSELGPTNLYVTGFKDSSIVARAALLIHVFALVCHVVSFSTPYWYILVSGSHVGIWTRCLKVGEERFVLCVNNWEKPEADEEHVALWEKCQQENPKEAWCFNVPDWFSILQGVETAGVFLELLAFVMLLSYVFVAKLHRSRKFVYYIVCTYFASGILTASGGIFLAAHIHRVGLLSWSFAMSLVAAALAILIGILLSFEAKSL